MAKVKIENVIEHLESDISTALYKTVMDAAPDCGASKSELFRHFVRAVYNECRVWETVPDRYVKAE